MKRLQHFLLVILLLQVTTACLKDDHFGQSPYNTLYSFELEDQIGEASIDQVTCIVQCSVDSTADVTSLVLVDYRVSNYASLNPGPGIPLDFTDTVFYTVTAENGNTRVYKVILSEAKQNEQVRNSGFQDWYDTGNGYLEIGTDADNIVWSTGNAGASISGVIPTYPEVMAENDTAAIMETKSVSIGPRIAAGSLFTGIFELNILNPPKSIKPGIPFSSRPAAFKISMKYQPGEENKDGDGNPLPYDDMADIYVLLEVRNGDAKQRLATAWYRSSDTYTDWHELQVDFMYGELDGSYPDFMKPEDGQYADPSATPTHISVILSSSAGGGEFEGAVGSLLSVNDFELIY
ncbi:MAG: PCMD domain-containing protein [bacterium]|jgi:hypothetical protein